MMASTKASRDFLNALTLPTQGDVVNLPTQEIVAPVASNIPGGTMPAISPQGAAAWFGGGALPPAPAPPAPDPGTHATPPGVNLPPAPGLEGAIAASNATSAPLPKMRDPAAFTNTRGIMTPEDEANLRAQQGDASKGAVFAKPPPSAPMGAGGAAPDPLAGLRKQVGATYDEEIAANRRSAEAQGRANDLEGMYAGQKANAIASTPTHRAQDEQAIQAQTDRIRSAVDEAAQAHANLDPKAWAKSQSAGAKILWTIAAGLAGVANPQHNQVLSQINEEVNRDIDAQKAKANAKERAVGQERGVLADMYDRFGNRDKAEAAARAALFESYDLRQKQYAAQIGTQDAIARSDALSAQLQRQKAMALAHMMPGAAGGGSSPAALKKDAAAYSERLEKSGIPEAATSLGNLSKIASQEDPAGFGLPARAAVALGLNGLLSEEGRANRATVDQEILKVAHATGRVTPAEVEAVRQAYIGAIGNPEAMRRFYQQVQQEVAAKARNIDAGTDPEARALYQQRGGIDTGQITAPARPVPKTPIR